MSEHPVPPPLGPRDETTFKGGVYWFDGLLEGAAGDSAAMRAPLPRLAELGLGTADIEIESGRFSLLAADGRRPIVAERGLELESIRSELEALVLLSPRPEACESTLRATELGHEKARETLFAVKNGEVMRVSRERPLRPEDAAKASRPAPGTVDPKIAGRRKMMLVGGLVLAGLFIIWQSGIVGALFAPPASELEIDTGPFEDLLAIELEARFLAYEVTLGRGPGFPTSPSAAKAAQEAAPDLRTAKAIAAVAEGEVIYVEILDAKGNVIGGAGLSLRPLLEGEKVITKTTLPARGGTHVLRLALTPGIGHKGM